MKNQELLRTTFKTLCFSWGSDAPPEAVWSANDLLRWLERENNFKLEAYFEETLENYDSVIADLFILIGE